MNTKKPFFYSDSAKEVAFLLGGIGTGNVSIGSRGDLRDWEIFNRPEKNNRLPYTGFYIWTKTKEGKIDARMLEAQIQGPHRDFSGYPSFSLAGLPRFKHSIMNAEYPFVKIDFKDSSFPLKVSLLAFTPFVPLDVDSSSFPAFLLRYKIKNPLNKSVEVAIAASLANMCGGFYKEWGNFKPLKMAVNECRKKIFSGLFFYSPEIDSTSTDFGTMAILTDAKPETVSFKPLWLNRGWWDGAHDFWDDFFSDGTLEEASYGTFLDLIDKPDKPEIVPVGSISVKKIIPPKEEKIFQFVISWHFPNRIKRWETKKCSVEGKENIVKNYYSKLFSDAWDAGEKLFLNLSRLEKLSKDFHHALFSSTLPYYVIDAISSNITVLRSNTCFLLEDGTFAAWEGCCDSGGCCEGSCTHVWNYAQTVAFLFPQLEQSMRRVEFGLETDSEGKMAFRTKKIFNKDDLFNFHAAADGQNGTIIRLYRDWKFSGNDALVKDLWPSVKRALDYAFKYWDSDGDFVLDNKQHNTYDIEFYGPNSLVNSLFFGALKAGIEMANFMSDIEYAKKLQEAFEKGSKKMDELLWNGEYYEQKIDDVNKYRYQYGKGCLSDQVFGQFLSHVAGLGYVLPKDHVKKSILSVFKYNFKKDLSKHPNVQRTYALNNESGLLVASWPEGNRPRFPFVYADEVWTGIEYQVAAHLVYEGFVDKGLKIVQSARARHDGYKRNPFNEVECGHHYVRSMANWALLLALSGFKYDMHKKIISFNPRINKNNFSCFFSTAKAWGIYRQKKDKKGRLLRSLEVLYGDLEGVTLQ